MEFTIEQSINMEGQDHFISLPTSLRLEMGALIGQFLQVKGEESAVLQIREPIHLEQDKSLVSAETFKRIKGQDIRLKILEITVGCDPEFFIFYPNKSLASASTYLPHLGEIGCDGILGELRPHYDTHESGVVGNIKRLIPQIPGKMKKQPWATNLPETGHGFLLKAFSWYMGLPAGFHVHLGLPPEILNTRKDFNRAALSYLVRCLDWYVSVPTLPLESNPERRLRGGQYGKPSDCRPTNVTLEYRTPGAFYLRTPELATGLMGLSLLVTENAVSRMKVASGGFVNLHKLSEKDFQEIMPTPPTEAIKETLLEKGVTKAQKVLEGIRRRLENLPTYEKHREGVEKFFRIVENKEKPGENLLENWKE